MLENPKKANTTLVTNTEPDIKYFYVLVPDDESWKSTVPMWSGDGTFASGQPLKVDPNMCGWYYAVWMDEPMPEQFIIFKDDDVDLEEIAIEDGVAGNTEVGIRVDAAGTREGDVDIAVEDPAVVVAAAGAEQTAAGLRSAVGVVDDDGLV